MIACYGFCLLHHTNKTGLQWHDVFIAFAVFQALAICYHTAAFPGKRVVNKRLQTSIIIMQAPVIF